MKTRILFLPAVCILAFGISSSPAVSPERTHNKKNIQIEISLIGIVQKADTGYCMDGAVYQLQHVVINPGGKHGRAVTRLTSNNTEVNAFLKKVVGSRQRVVVTGYPEMGTECPHLAIFYAGPAQNL